MTSRSALHGGEVARIAAELLCEPDEILDFSANINPRGLPRSALTALLRATDKLVHYPDWTRHPLRQSLADRHAIAIDNVILGAGASALIMDAFRAVRPRRCLCFIPAFAEYRRACEAVGAEFHSVQLRPEDQFEIDFSTLTADLKRLRPDLLVLNNPHNPSGSLTDRGTLEAIIRLSAEFKTKLLVDEAFVDYAPAHQATVRAAMSPDIISIRSLTKFFGCPGLRVGYAVTNHSLASEIERQVSAWPVGTLAMDALCAALQDSDYERKTLEENARERIRLAEALADLGLASYSAAANFLLIDLPDHWPDAFGLREHLLSRYKILVRDCSSFEGLPPNRFIRIAVLDWSRNRKLIEALSTIK